MTWRAIYVPAGHFAPLHADYDAEPDARLRALAEERADAGWVDVVEVRE